MKRKKRVLFGSQNSETVPFRFEAKQKNSKRNRGTLNVTTTNIKDAKPLLERFRHINMNIAKNRFHVPTPVEDSMESETHRITVEGKTPALADDRRDVSYTILWYNGITSMPANDCTV